MTSFQFILFQGSLYLALYVCLQQLFFRKTQAYIWHRWLLLTLPFFAFIIPIFLNNLQQSATVTTASIFNFAPIFIGKKTIVQDTSVFNTALSIGTILLFIWAIGFTILFIKLILDFRKTIKRIPRDVKEKINRYSIHIDNKSHAAWTFYNHIILPENLSKSDVSMILLHEITHAKQKHTLDILFAEMVRCILWWNPFIYLWINQIKENHEYLADKSVLKQYDKKSYGNLILNRTFQTKQFNLTNTFINKAILKRRIIMMTTQSKMRKSLPIFGAICLVALFTTISYGQKNVSTNKESIVQNDSVYKYVKQMPQFPGGRKSMYNFIIKHIKYPHQDKKDSVQGTVYARFVVSSEGKINDIKILRSPSQAMSEEVIRVLKLMPTWIPGKQNGKKVGVIYILPFKFSLDNKVSKK